MIDARMQPQEVLEILIKQNLRRAPDAHSSSIQSWARGEVIGKLSARLEKSSEHTHTHRERPSI